MHLRRVRTRGKGPTDAVGGPGGSAARGGRLGAEVSPRIICAGSIRRCARQGKAQNPRGTHQAEGARARTRIARGGEAGGGGGQREGKL